MLTYWPPTTERVSYFRSKLQAPLRNIIGSCLREASASAAFLSIHFFPSARQSAASAGSALILASRKTAASIFLFLNAASGLGSAARAVAAAKQARMPARVILPVNVKDAAESKGNPSMN